MENIVRDLGFNEWVDKVRYVFGTDYELRSGCDALLIYVNDELVAGFSNVEWVGWLQVGE